MEHKDHLAGGSHSRVSEGMQVADRDFLPCPFCGGEANLDAHDSLNGEKLIYCTVCFASTCPTRNALEMWNRRTTTPGK